MEAMVTITLEVRFDVPHVTVALVIANGGIVTKVVDWDTNAKNVEIVDSM